MEYFIYIYLAGYILSMPYLVHYYIDYAMSERRFYLPIKEIYLLIYLAIFLGWWFFIGERFLNYLIDKEWRI